MNKSVDLIYNIDKCNKILDLIFPNTHTKIHNYELMKWGEVNAMVGNYIVMHSSNLHHML